MGKICLPCVGEGPPQALESISLVQTLALAVLAAVEGKGCWEDL